MTEPAPTAPTPRPPLTRALKVVAIVDVTWALLGMSASLVTAVVLGFALSRGPAGASEHGGALTPTWATFAASACVSPLVHACLVACVISILRRHASAYRWVLAWTIGVALFFAFDVYVLVVSWSSPLYAIAIPFVLLTPAWALVHVFLLRRAVECGELAAAR